MDGGRNSDISFMLTIRIIPAGFSVRLGCKWNLKLSHFLASGGIYKRVRGGNRMEIPSETKQFLPKQDQLKLKVSIGFDGPNRMPRFLLAAGIMALT